MIREHQNRPLLRYCSLPGWLFMLLALCCGSALGNGWVLNETTSNVSFSSVKNTSISEGHRFQSITGSVSHQGRAQLVIDLHSVETRIAIRDERMKKLLFNVSPQAVFRADLGQDFAALSSSEMQVAGMLELHGVAIPLKVVLEVQRLTKDRVLVFTSRPIVLNAANFNLLEGIEALRQIAGLQSITPTVPVYLTLVFERTAG